VPITSVPDTGRTGNYVNYGVREFAMSAIANGLALHGGSFPMSARSSRSRTTRAMHCARPR
jgi:transketolase